MNDQRREDQMLEAVRAARPAAPADGDSSRSAAAQKLHARVLADGRTRRRVRPGGLGWLVPVAGALVAVAVVIVAIGVSGHGRPRAASVAQYAGRTALTPSQYVFAVGGDLGAQVSRAQLDSGGRVLFQAEQILRRRCMRQRGLGWAMEPVPGASPLASATGYPSTFYPEPSPGAYPEQTLLALRQSQGFGIHVAAVARPNPAADPEDRYVSSLSPAQRKRWLRAFSGPNGCLGTAETDLYGSRRAANIDDLLPSTIDNYLNALVYDRHGDIASRHRVTAAAVARWSRCMGAATGRAWSDENALISGLTGDTRTQQRSEAFARQEIRLAVDDTRCAYSSGQAQTFAATFRNAANHLPPRLEVQLRFALAHRRGWIRRARQIVRGARRG